MKKFLYLRCIITGTFLGFIICLSSCSKLEFDLGPDFGNTGCLGCGPDLSNSIFIYYFGFSPDSLSVKKGTIITWSNADLIDHNVISNNGSSFSSGTIVAGGEYKYTADTVGSFHYHCQKHGESGKIVVTP